MVPTALMTASTIFHIILVSDSTWRVLFCLYGVPIVMMPLDVTHQLLTRKDRVKRIAEIGTAPARAMVEMLEFFERFDVDKYGSDGGPLHDPSVIAYLLKPELFQGRDCNVEIEVQSELTVGMTVVDWWGVTGRKANVRFMNTVMKFLVLARTVTDS